MRILLGLMSFLIMSSNAWAWGDEGHKIVCEIAMRLAVPSTRAEIQRLIKTDTEFDFFSDACTWPDHPRKRGAELRKSRQRFERANIGQPMWTCSRMRSAMTRASAFNARASPLSLLRPKGPSPRRIRE